MSAKTRIWVFHMKELIYTAVFIVLGIFLLLLMIFMFSGSPEQEAAADVPSRYTAGVYTASMILGGNHAFQSLFILVTSSLASVLLSTIISYMIYGYYAVSTVLRHRFEHGKRRLRTASSFYILCACLCASASADHQDRAGCDSSAQQ